MQTQLIRSQRPIRFGFTLNEMLVVIAMSTL